MDGVFGTHSADNGAYTGRYPGDHRYLAWLSARIPHLPWCAFATAPDVVGDGASTLARSLPMLDRIRRMGYPAALVAQDGLEHLPIPWEAFDVLFLGGSTGWKLGPAAADLANRARQRGLSVHMGRVTASSASVTPQPFVAARSTAPTSPTARTTTCPPCWAGWPP